MPMDTSCCCLPMRFRTRRPTSRPRLDGCDLGGGCHRKAAIEELASKLRDSGISVDPVTCTGYPPQKFLEQATSVRADLIAMGTHGRSGIDRLLEHGRARAVKELRAAARRRLRALGVEPGGIDG